MRTSPCCSLRIDSKRKLLCCSWSGTIMSGSALQWQILVPDRCKLQALPAGLQKWESLVRRHERRKRQPHLMRTSRQPHLKCGGGWSASAKSSHPFYAVGRLRFGFGSRDPRCKSQAWVMSGAPTELRGGQPRGATRPVHTSAESATSIARGRWSRALWLAFWTRFASQECTRRVHCKEPFFVCKHIHGHVVEEEWEVIYWLVSDGKESKTYLRSFCTDSSWRSRCARKMCEADSDCTRASLHQRRLFWFLFFNKSARKLLVEPPMTVGLSLTSASVTAADTCPCSWLASPRVNFPCSFFFFFEKRRPHLKPMFRLSWNNILPWTVARRITYEQVRS